MRVWRNELGHVGYNLGFILWTHSMDIIGSSRSFETVIGDRTDGLVLIALSCPYGLEVSVPYDPKKQFCDASLH